MNKCLVIYLCLIGFLLRAIYIVYFNSDITWPDEERFWEEGQSLLDSFTFTAGGKHAHDMPLTGSFIALGSLLTDGSILGVKLLFALISAITIYFIAALAYEIYPSSASSTIAAGISSVYPFFIYYSALLLSETLFLLFIVLFFLQLLKRGEQNSRKAWIIAGLLHLTRPTLLFFLPVVWLWQYIMRYCSLRGLLISAMLFILIILPWGVRNLVSLNKFHLTTSGSGQVLWEGNNPWNKTGGVSGSFSDSEAYLNDIPEGLNELDEDDLKKQKAISYIKENPQVFIKRSWQKFIRFWHLWPNFDKHKKNKYKYISLLSFAPILILSLLAVVGLRVDFKRLSILYLFIVYYTLIHVVTIGSIRYRLPLEPLMVALAASYLARFKEPVLSYFRENTWGIAK